VRGGVSLVYRGEFPGDASVVAAPNAQCEILPNFVSLPIITETKLSWNILAISLKAFGLIFTFSIPPNSQILCILFLLSNSLRTFIFDIRDLVQTSYMELLARPQSDNSSQKFTETWKF
jgi:hypothetical protein